MAAASLSPITCSFSGSQRIDRPSRSDILARLHGGGHAVAVFHFAQRALAAAHAVQPVALVHRHGVFAAGAVAGVGRHAALGWPGSTASASHRYRPARRSAGPWKRGMSLTGSILFSGSHLVAAGQRHGCPWSPGTPARARIAAQALASRMAQFIVKPGKLHMRVLQIGRLAVVFQGVPAAAWTSPSVGPLTFMIHSTWSMMCAPRLVIWPPE